MMMMMMVNLLHGNDGSWWGARPRVPGAKLRQGTATWSSSWLFWKEKIVRTLRIMRTMHITNIMRVMWNSLWLCEIHYDYDDEDGSSLMVLYKVAPAMGILCLFSRVGRRKLINLFPDFLFDGIFQYQANKQKALKAGNNFRNMFHTFGGCGVSILNFWSGDYGSFDSCQKKFCPKLNSNLDWTKFSYEMCQNRKSSKLR